MPKITKFDTATWTVLHVDVRENVVDTISISPNECILASTTHLDKIVRLWNLETNEPIATQLHHEDPVNCATFSADGKLLVTGCDNGHIYIWDVSAMIEDGLPSDIADAIRLPQRSKMLVGCPKGFSIISSLTRVLIHPNLMGNTTAPLQHRVNASSAVFPLSGAAPSLTWRLNVRPSLDLALSAGLETWSLACYADEMDQIQSRSHTQVPSLKTIMRERSQLLARLTLPMLIPCNNRLAQQHRAHRHRLRHHLPLPLRHFPLSLLPRG